MLSSSESVVEFRQVLMFAVVPVVVAIVVKLSVVIVLCVHIWSHGSFGKGWSLVRRAGMWRESISSYSITAR